MATLAGITIFSGRLCAFQVYILQFEPVLLLLLGLAVSSSFYVGVWVLEIHYAISQEHTYKSYDLLAVLPDGKQGADWTIACACLHRSDRLGWIDLIRRAFSVLLFIIFMLVFITLFFVSPNTDLTQLLSIGLDTSLIVVSSYTEHTQAVVLGVLVSILASHYRKAKFDEQFLTLLGFLTIQLFTFLLALITTYWIESAAMGLLVFYIARLGLIILLWNKLKYFWLSENLNYG